MNLRQFSTFDPHLLVGMVNTELRNHCVSLDDLVKTHDIDHEALVSRLAQAGYQYHTDQNQFR